MRSGAEKPPSELIDAAREMSAEEVTEGFRIHVLNHIADSKRKAVIRAIRAVLREDSIENTTCIGYDGYNKETILSHDSFGEASILAAVFRYAFVCTDNTEMKDSIKEIPKDFVDKLIKMSCLAAISVLKPKHKIYNLICQNYSLIKFYWELSAISRGLFFLLFFGLF